MALTSVVISACAFAFCAFAGAYMIPAISMPAKMAMMPITTNNSTSVKFLLLLRIFLFLKCYGYDFLSF